MNDEPRRGFGFGFGLAGLLAAGLSYFAFNEGFFSGPAWRNVLAAVVIGGGSAALLLSLEKTFFRRPARPPTEPATIKGAWGCPRCGAVYVPEATTCSDCRVPLVAGSGSPAR